MLDEKYELSNKIGSNLKAAREAKGLSQEKLAAAAGLSSRTVLNIEQGKHSPTSDTLMHLAGALELPLSQLLD